MARLLLERDMAPFLIALLSIKQEGYLEEALHVMHCGGLWGRAMVPVCVPSAADCARALIAYSPYTCALRASRPSSSMHGLFDDAPGGPQPIQAPPCSPCCKSRRNNLRDAPPPALHKR
eukprot:scaffold22379_cov145-Isochrysis_galbana.AAC.2